MSWIAVTKYPGFVDYLLLITPWLFITKSNSGPCAVYSWLFQPPSSEIPFIFKHMLACTSVKLTYQEWNYTISTQVRLGRYTLGFGGWSGPRILTCSHIYLSHYFSSWLSFTLLWCLWHLAVAYGAVEHVPHTFLDSGGTKQREPPRPWLV